MDITITDQERDELVKIVENYLTDTRVETRRTRNREWHDKLRQEQELLHQLVTRLKALH